MENPKVACSTIKKNIIANELSFYPNYINGDHLHIRTYSPMLNFRRVGNVRKYLERKPFIFTFVRNPYSRILSAYLDKIKGGYDAYYNNLSKTSSITREKFDSLSFSDFVSIVAEQDVSDMDQHWRTQYYQTVQHGLEYSYIGRFENLEEDLSYVYRRIGLSDDPRTVTVRPHRQDASEKVDDLVDKETKRRIADKYAIDFETFGYPV